MARIKLAVPEIYSFTCPLPLRITDLNYGGHVGNDTILSLIHEARMLFLREFQFTELSFAGVGTIMADVTIEFRNELFYGDKLIASVAVGDVSGVSFDLYYKLEKESGDRHILVALAKTGMVCYDYGLKKVVRVPNAAILAFGK